MTKYVKICPRCGHQNDELAEACDQDGEFLGMVPSTLLRPEPLPPTPAAPAAAPKPASAPQVAVTQRFDTPTQLLYLETSTGETVQIGHGQVLGQAHPSSSAHVQLHDLPGLNYVHRSHCLFEFVDNAWRITAIAQPEYTNPTFVNGKRIAPGEHAPLRNGDKLMLSNVALSVRIISF